MRISDWSSDVCSSDLHVYVKGLVKMGLGSRRERRNRPCARVREKTVDVPMLLLHGRVEPIQIFQARYVAYYRRTVSSDERCGPLQLFLSSPGDHHMLAFFHEAPGPGHPIPPPAPPS